MAKRAFGVGNSGTANTTTNPFGARIVVAVAYANMVVGAVNARFAALAHLARS